MVCRMAPRIETATWNTEPFSIADSTSLEEFILTIKRHTDR